MNKRLFIILVSVFQNFAAAFSGVVVFALSLPVVFGVAKIISLLMGYDLREHLFGLVDESSALIGVTIISFFLAVRSYRKSMVEMNSPKDDFHKKS